MILRASLVYALTFALIVARRLRWLPIGRPAGALVGACLMVASGVLRPDQAYAAIDHGTLALLFGMMLVNAHLEHAGLFRSLAARLERWPASSHALVAAVTVGAGVGSALLVNDAVCLMGAPVVLAVAERRRLHPLPLLLALALGSNVGGVMTLTGTPQCMIVGQLGRLSYTSYAAVMVPVGLVGLALTCAVLRVAFRTLPPAELSPGAVGAGAHEASGATVPDDPSLRAPSLLVLALLTAGFLARFDLAWTALCGAVLLLVLARRDAAAMFARVDWSVLLFFCGLFVVVGGLERSGASAALLAHAGGFLRGEPARAVPALSAVSVLGSNVVSNVPLVLLVGPGLRGLRDERLLWLTLAMSSTFAGNLTLLGSVANVIVSETAGERGGMTFRAYLRVGLPVTALTTLAGVGLLLALRASGYLALAARW